MAVASISAIEAPAVQAGGASTPAAQTDDDGFSFDDFLDIINPLQHLPVISTIYRHITGDTIKPLEQIAGDTLFGGLTGLASSVANYAFQKVAGESLGDMVYAFVTGEDDSKPTAVASADTSREATHAPTPLLGAQIAQAATPANSSGSATLLAAAEAKGVSPEVASRALSAYEASMLLPKMADASVL